MKKVITFGEVMMRLSTPGFERFIQADHYDATFGGSEANVAVSLTQLGIPADHVTVFPENDLGKAAAQTLRKYGLATDHLKFQEGRLGLYFLENGAIHRASKIVYDRFDSAFANMKPGMIDWFNVFKGASWFHYTGITPAISQSAADVCLEAVSTAKKMGLTVSGDINYRRNLWQYGKTARDIMPSLIDKTDVIVAGVTDFENCLGISGTDYASTCLKVMQEYKNIKKVTQTLRDSVSASHNVLEGEIFDGEKLIKSQQFDLTHIVDRVGGGDAFMAGLIYGFVHEKEDQFTIDFAVAASSLKHTIPGDVNLVSFQEVNDLVEGRNVGKLLR